MSERNVEVVRSLLGPFQGINVAEIDWGAEPIRQLLAGSCSPEIEVRTLESGMGAGVDPVYNGVDGVVSYLRAWMEPFTDYRVQWLEFIDEGDFVLVPCQQPGHRLGKRGACGAGARLRLRGRGRPDQPDPPVRHTG